MWRWVLQLVLLLFVLMVLPSVFAAACPPPITSSFSLTDNVAGAPNTLTCIRITASNVVFDCKGFNITNNGISGTTSGISIHNTGTKNVTIRNCPGISNYTYGVYVSGSNNTLTNNTAYDNTQHGFYLSSSSNNILTNNSVYNNAGHGFRIELGSNNILTNNSAYNIAYDGFSIYYGTLNTLTNNIAYNNRLGFYLETNSNSSTLSGNSAYNNTLSGFYALNNANNTLTNNTAYDNTQHGFYLSSSSNNILTNNTAYDNTQHGFYIRSSSNNNILTNNTAYSNKQYGFYIFDSNATNATHTRLYNNGYDLYISMDATARTVYLYNLTIDNPAGDFQNYTSLNIADTVDANTAYSINWTRISSALPAGFSSFRNKFVNIINQAAATSIDSITWAWQVSEETGYNESKFELWKYNASTNWTMLNNTPNTGANTLTLYNLNPASEYGILQGPPYPDCPDTDGNWTLTSSYDLSEDITCDQIDLGASSHLTIKGGYTLTANKIESSTGAQLTIEGDAILDTTNTELTGTTVSIDNGQTLKTEYSGTFSDTNTCYSSAGTYNLNIENTNTGSIQWTGGISAQVCNLSDTVTISSNYTYVNSTKEVNLNTSATITLSGLPFTGGAGDITIMRDINGDGTYTACPGGICTVVSYSGGVATFTVTQFSGYSVSGAVATVHTQSHWVNTEPAGNIIIEGGNVSNVTLNTNESTQKWAASYGNVTATLILAENGTSTYMYNWTWNASSGGEVCVTQNTTPNWATIAPTTAAAIDSIWGFTPTDGDSAANTYTDNFATFTINAVTITTTGTNHMGSSTFQSGAMNLTSGSVTQESEVAFCTNMSSIGTNYRNFPVSYEVMYATTAASGPGPIETYYFFVELSAS